MTERNPVIDFRRDFRPHTGELPDLDFNPDASLVTFIADRLPNAKARKELQSQLDDNERAILRALERI